MNDRIAVLEAEINRVRLVDELLALPSPEPHSITRYHVLRADRLFRHGFTREEAAELVGFSRNGIWRARRRLRNGAEKHSNL